MKSGNFSLSLLAHLLRCAVVSIFIILGILLIIKFSMLPQTSKRQNIPTITAPSVTPFPTTNIGGPDPLSVTTFGAWVLKQKDDQSEKIRAYVCSYCEEQVRQWRNWLIYSTVGKQGKIVEGIDLNTNKRFPIYTQQVKNRGRGNDVVNIHSLEIIGEYLYVAHSEYFSSEVLNRINLNNQDFTVEHVADLGAVYKEYGRYWADTGFGDGCGSENDRYLINPETHVLKLFIHENFGCSDGENIVGIFDANTLLVSWHVNNKPQDFDLEWKNISKVSIVDPAVRQIQITQDDFPESMERIWFDHHSNQTYALGKSGSEYIYDPQAAVFRVERHENEGDLYAIIDFTRDWPNLYDLPSDYFFVQTTANDAEELSDWELF